ncbi:hypothetical protein [Leptolyngbya sp. FACHB-261]|uniref:hypothetical protein n=1 Tax=Leptolyngbya sp. FACHB-261 TaxID=2692806 RepID=UPI0037C08CB0
MSYLTHARSADRQGSQEGLCDYVAHLQLHMTLQARNLVPTLSGNGTDSRTQLLHQTQADFEKLVSRQAL